MKWTICNEKSSKRGHVVDESGKLVILKRFTLGGGGTEEEDSDIERNEALCMAAPELLAAVKAFVSGIERALIDHKPIKELQNLIRRAEGEAVKYLEAFEKDGFFHWRVYIWDKAENKMNVIQKSDEGFDTKEEAIDAGVDWADNNDVDVEISF